jgi:hypothetical protein
MQPKPTTATQCVVLLTQHERAVLDDVRATRTQYLGEELANAQTPEAIEAIARRAQAHAAVTRGAETGALEPDEDVIAFLQEERAETVELLDDARFTLARQEAGQTVHYVMGEDQDGSIRETKARIRDILGQLAVLDGVIDRGTPREGA